jgi:hypothetical protein
MVGCAMSYRTVRSTARPTRTPSELRTNSPADGSETLADSYGRSNIHRGGSSSAEAEVPESYCALARGKPWAKQRVPHRLVGW